LSRRTGKAGRRSLERSALVEAVEQFTRAVSQIATVPGTPALRREQIKLQVSLITPIVHVKGYSAPETKDAVEQARLLLAQADALGEAPEDPLQLFTVLYGFFVANVMAFNGDACRDIAAQTLELAEKQSASFPRVLGHNNLGGSLMFAGDIAEARVHLDQAISLYDPAAHRQLAMRFGEDQTVATLSLKARALWLLGYPEAALRDVGDALKQARETGQAATRLFALHFTAVPLILSGSYSQATALATGTPCIGGRKGSAVLEGQWVSEPGCLFALTDDASNKAIQTITSGITALLRRCANSECKTAR
jgi:tetratricopeptide (TPR) repeat protein